MLCVWWNFKGVIQCEFVPNGLTVDALLYSQQQERVYEILRRIYPALVNRNRVLLKQGNARPHIERTTMTKCQDSGGIELLPYPAYSHDLVPSNYYLFRSMAYLLRGRNLENFDVVEVGLNEFFT